MAITIKEIVIAPFGRVRFRDFFFADVITSMGVPLKDLGALIYYLAHIKNVNNQKNSQDYKVIVVYNIIASMAPFWWRFWQCINKRYNSGQNVHFINAGKYFSKLVPPFILIFLPDSKKFSN